VTEKPGRGVRLRKIEKPGVDGEAAWTKKAGKLHYGYKKHHAADMNGLVLAVETTHANRQVMGLLVERSQPAKRFRVYADKGYCAHSYSTYLKSKKLRNGIMEKAARNCELGSRQKRRNRLVSAVRHVVERTFAGRKRWSGPGGRDTGAFVRTHCQHIPKAICYNLKRASRLWTQLNLTR
jgi:transposase, IS5 family